MESALRGARKCPGGASERTGPGPACCWPTFLRPRRRPGPPGLYLPPVLPSRDPPGGHLCSPPLGPPQSGAAVAGVWAAPASIPRGPLSLHGCSCVQAGAGWLACAVHAALRASQGPFLTGRTGPPDERWAHPEDEDRPLCSHSLASSTAHGSGAGGSGETGRGGAPAPERQDIVTAERRVQPLPASWLKG